jgi:hypothetical protein
LTARRIAAKGADRMHEIAAMNTPVRTGNLRTSFYQMPVNKTVNVGPWPAYESGIATDVKYAPYVEYGTGIYGPSHAPYVITPKTPGGTLAWRDPHTGKWVFATRVLHPGSPGNHMVAIAAHIVEAEADGSLFDGVLAEWARSVEAAAK